MLFFLVFNSCKKDDLKSRNINPEDNPTHQISNAEIEKWEKNNPVLQYLALDWKNAKQTVYQGRQVIKISLLNENKLSTQKTEDRKASAVGSHTQTNVLNAYFNQHPPEVFLVKDDKDSLHSSLLNFIPDNQTSGFGQNGKWTGKLYEWNMNSDSLFVQETKESELLLKYIIKTPKKINAEQKNSKIKTKTIWDFFGPIGDFFNNLGFFMGLPFASNVSWYSNSCYNSTGSGYGCVNTYNWAGDALGWIGNLFSGVGGSNVYGNYGYTNNYYGGSSYNTGYNNSGNYNGYNAGANFYGLYMPGYNNYSPTYTNYPINWSNSGSAAPSGGFQANELIDLLSITDGNIQNFLRGNDKASADFHDYLIRNTWSTESENFVKWAAGYLADNPNVDFEDFKQEYLHDLNNPTDELDVSTVDNGIEVDEPNTPPSLSQLPLLGSTTDRNNTADLTYGLGGNTQGLNSTYLFNYSNDQLSNVMKEVLDIGTTFGLRDVATLFWNTFRTNNNPSTVLQDNRLNEAIAVNSSFTDFLKIFGNNLRTELTKTNGQINMVSLIDLKNSRPIFGGIYNTFHGLTILINDTEKTEIRLEKFETIPGSNKFFATVEVTITDHFGVDKNDALGKEHIHSGFTAWWLLQHTRGKVPFITKVVIRKTIIGYY